MTMLNKKHSEETKKLMSERSKGNKAFLGRKHTEETKKKMSVPRPNRRGIPAWNKGLSRFKNYEEKTKSGNLKKYGITIDEFNEMLEKQKSLCAICFLPETRLNRAGKLNQLSVDHCHDTGKIRGLLCSKCNFAIGHLNNKPELCINAFNYLNNHLN